MRRPRDQVGYVFRSRNLAERCATCLMQTATYECERVVGPIAPLGWCMLYQRRLSAPIPGDVMALQERERSDD